MSATSRHKKNGAKRAGKLQAAASGEPKPLSSTWWGKRWIAALESASRDYVNRLGSGRAFARAGRVHDLAIAPGRVTATVEDTDEEIYAVSLRIDTFDARTWNKVITTMSRQALFAAQLLAGEMPKEIDRVFRACARSLFPARQHELETDCSCADWASPCKHVAATHYLLGEALDRDPFLLFELRGRSKEQVLQALGRLRSAGVAQAAPSNAQISSTPSPADIAVALDSLSSAQFEQAEREPPALRFQLRVPSEPGAVLRQLGTPASWSVSEAPMDLFLPIYERAGAYARELATRSERSEPDNARAGRTRAKRTRC